MPELELTRAPGDSRLYVLPGIWTLRLGGGFSRRATVTIEDPAAIEPGLLLFAAFVARGLAEDAASAASAGASAGAVG